MAESDMSRMRGLIKILIMFGAAACLLSLVVATPASAHPGVPGHKHCSSPHDEQSAVDLTVEAEEHCRSTQMVFGEPGRLAEVLDLLVARQKLLDAGNPAGIDLADFPLSFF